MIDLDTWLNANNPSEGAKWTLASSAGVIDAGLITGSGTYNDGPRAFLLDASALISTSLPGDYNHDGKVDAADYVVWRDGLGSSYTQADYNIWRSNFGRIAGIRAVLVSSSNTVVPEPATFVLLMFAAARFSLPRRRVA